jgi:hypothetical protein
MTISITGTCALYQFSRITILNQLAARFHGWAAARRNLENAENKKEFVIFGIGA